MLRKRRENVVLVDEKDSSKSDEAYEVDFKKV